MTVVQWLEKELKKIPFVNPKEVFEQAKEMEKQQIIDAWKDGYGGDEHSEIEYYTSTYGSKGSDATSSQTEKCCTPEGQIKRYVDCIGCDRKASSQTTSDKWKEYQDWLNEVPEISEGEVKSAFKKGFYRWNEPIEISDEEIEKEGWKYCYENKISSTNIVHWISACKWYREQLKQRQ